MTNKRSVGRCIAVILTILFAAVCVQAGPPGSGWNKVWYDEFNDYNVDSSKWKIQNMQIGQYSWYYPNRVSENGSSLVIENISLNGTGPNGEKTQGARIDSKTQWNRGYFEVRCRVDWATEHVWPTFWMWKWQSSGPEATEFDIMEYSYWHSTPTQSHHYVGKTGTSTRESHLAVNSYHTWGVLWEADKVQFYIDENPTLTSSNPSDPGSQTLPIILSSSPPNQRLPDPGENLPRFFVDWVRVHQGGTSGSGGGGSSAPIGQTIALRADGNWKYVFANGGQSGWPLQTRSSIGGYGKFRVENAGGGYVALRSSANWKFATVDTGDGNRLKATSSSIGTAQKFKWEVLSGNQIALKAAINNQYIYADGGQSGWPLKTRSSIGGWGKFTWSQQ